MAGAVSLTLSSVPKLSLKPLLCSSLSTPFPSKHKRRKNYLRPKILTKPFPSSTSAIPITPLESSPVKKPLDVVVFEPPSEEIDEFEQFQVSESSGVTGENSGVFGKFSAHSVLKIGFGFVGIFVFQTLISVWMMGNRNSQDKDGNLNGFQRDSRSKNGKFLNNGKVGSSSSTNFYFDESELDEKVKEIRAMAREAREIEKKESKNDEEEGDMLDEALNSNSKMGIEKEIGARLNMLEKKLNSKKESFPGSFIGLLDKLKDGEDAKDVNKKLFVKKKFKFRGPEKISSNGGKGFSGLKNGSKSSYDNGTATRVSGIEEVDDGKTVVSQNSDPLPSDKEKIEEKLGLLHDDTSVGSEISEGRLSPEIMKSTKSRDLNTQNLKIFRKENQEAKTESDKHASLHTSERRDVSNNKPRADKVEVNQSGIKTDPWWLKLPYVLVILMQRGDDPDGLGGLFTFQISSEDQEEGDTYCAVAFEDRGDANNFCYLLECFFEDLGDFSAEVVPMSVKELREVAKSHAKDVLVVKKGQLKLYAGQPFSEVEMALQSIANSE